jgi:2-polyprenyl-6-hydroxyphenyl methylase/3-demethylubiquinone-9 3-methyltransferase
MGYYSEKLSGVRLRECYAVAPPRVKQYLDAEIRFVLGRLEPEDAVLELGCGYGRVALALADVAGRVVGIDTSVESLALARKLAGHGSACEFLEMDAAELRFPNGAFDAVVCIQNGVCAFGVDQLRLLEEAVRVTRPGGRVMLSSYSHRFWPHRLQWFEVQAERGLVGEIDYSSTGEGVIACKDGFRAGAMSREDFEALCARADLKPVITEVDGSSLFCELRI